MESLLDSGAELSSETVNDLASALAESTVKGKARQMVCVNRDGSVAQCISLPSLWPGS